MTRWKASAIHLGLSIAVALSLAALLAATWYPPAYATAVGGLGLLGILAGVDVCLGPLLTLIVYAPGKASLRFDLSVIVLLQVLALGYGLYTIYWARPVYLVFAVDRFEMVAAVDIAPEDLAKARREEFRSLPLTGPQVVAAQGPTDPAEKSRMLMSALSGGPDLQNLPQYYVHYEAMAAQVRAKAQPLEQAMAKSDAARAALSAYVESHRLKPSKVKTLPLRARHDQTVLIDAETAAVLGVVDLSPW